MLGSASQEHAEGVLLLHGQPDEVDDLLVPPALERAGLFLFDAAARRGEDPGVVPPATVYDGILAGQEADAGAVPQRRVREGALEDCIAQLVANAGTKTCPSVSTHGCYQSRICGWTGSYQPLAGVSARSSKEVAQSLGALPGSVFAMHDHLLRAVMLWVVTFMEPLGAPVTKDVEVMARREEARKVLCIKMSSMSSVASAVFRGGRRKINDNSERAIMDLARHWRKEPGGPVSWPQLSCATDGCGDGNYLISNNKELQPALGDCSRPRD